MKKLAVIVGLFAVFAAHGAFAVVDDVKASASTVTTAGFTNTYMVRGLVEGVIVEIPTAKTATVSIVTASGVTLYTGTDLTSATDGYVPLRYQAKGSTGAGLTWITAQASIAGAATNVIYEKMGIAEEVTITVNPAANTTGTNTYSAQLIVSK